uniref:Lysozyme n=1 Tax=Rhabditophanes sp. KR3021 TaxID=114890 RepID=A0AC35U3K3_9BILA
MTSKDKIFQCQYKLGVDMNNDICQAEASYATCMMNVYEPYCGKDAGVYTCNVVKTGVEHALPQCTSNLISCPKYSFA